MHDVLTLEKAENIARLTGHGTITCESLREACPWLNDDILADIVQDDYTGSTLQANRLNARSRPAPILKFVQVPADYFPHYKFKPEDTFELTVAGQNILYQLEKEAESSLMTQKSIQASIEAANWAKIAVAVAVILYIIDVLRGR